MSVAPWVASAVSSFGVACRDKLADPLGTLGREAAIRAPLERLLGRAGRQIGVPAVFHDEVRDTERQVRPDYGVSVNGAITGYVEVKAPGRSIDPATLSGHDLRQWNRQKDLPNLLYTNGTDWRLYRDGEAVGEPVRFTGSLDSAGEALAAPAAFEQLVTDFLKWSPAPITSVGALVRAVAPLTRLLRGEVADQLRAETRAVAAGGASDQQPFSGLARDWRALLFPSADDETFADGYAQAITFALLLARTEGIPLDGASLHHVGKTLGADHSLMGKALQLLTEDVAAEFKVTLDLLVRVVGAVDWERVRRGRRDTYLHLYEHFLEQYDHELRKQSGTYYTPSEVVEQMTRLTEEALVEVLGLTQGFRDDAVHVVDPAMGTGTYLLSVLERIAARVGSEEGPGAVAGAVGSAARRLNGFELQMGPYAVAELRASDLLGLHGVTDPADRVNLFVTNTLDDPFAAESHLSQSLAPIARSRRKANEVKAKAHVTVVLGNPPYRERADGMGAWVESGSAGGGPHANGVLADFREPGNGRVEYVLKNLYVYFWRWATWKVWESTGADPDGDAGVVCFITTSGYMRGPGFKGMRRYLREWASEGWIIDLTPEGQTPDVATRIFPGVRQPLCIGLFVRRADKGRDQPARVRVRSVAGRRADKFAQLAEVSLGDREWAEARTDWTAPFTAASSSGWDDFPALADLMPWVSPGVKANRTWVYAPSAAILADRWQRLAAAPNPRERAAMFKETQDRDLARGADALPGHGTGTLPALATLWPPMAPPVRIGYRSFDRQHVIPDGRAIDRPRPALWSALVPGQVYVVEQHSKSVTTGPGLVFSALIPDMDFFKGSEGGRTLPLLHPDGSANVAPGLLQALGATLGMGGPVAAEDLLAYVAGATAHPAFTATFADELATPGVRVPITTDPALWAEAVAIGHRVLSLHTYGAHAITPSEPLMFPAGHPQRPLNLTAIRSMPSLMTYDPATSTLTLGDGAFGPVDPRVWAYDVGGRNVLKSWFNYRKAAPGGKKTSPLDHVHASSWDPQWTTELLELITVLTRLVDLESKQRDLLDRVVAGPLASRAALATLGVFWPTSSRDRSPRMAAWSAGDGSTLL